MGIGIGNVTCFGLGVGFVLQDATPQLLTINVTLPIPRPITKHKRTKLKNCNKVIEF